MPHSIRDVLSNVNGELWRAAPGVARSAVSVLRSDWPCTYVALVETYFDRAQIGRTYDGSKNDAGYLLAGLRSALDQAQQMYAQFAVDRLDVDRAFAGEVRYMYSRGRQARDLRAYLVRSWLNLLVERPERIWPGRYGRR